MGLLVFVILAVLLWIALAAQMEFFAFLLIIAIGLLLYVNRTNRSGSGASYDYDPHPEEDKNAWRAKLRRKPQENFFKQLGVAVNNVTKSILYIFGFIKDKEEEDDPIKIQMVDEKH